jgi:RHS repeat-associated protein
VAFYTTGTGAATHSQHQDWLGTERLRTTYNGGVEGSYISLPWGDGYTATGSDLDVYHYAMLDHDSESDTEHAQFRQYSNSQGHWLSPDPYSGSYDFSNPQSFNRYAYITDNPLSGVDPSGLNCDVYAGCADDCLANPNCGAGDFGNGGGGDGSGGGGAAFGFMGAGASGTSAYFFFSLGATSTGAFGTGSFAWDGSGWINDYDGEEIDDAAAAEENLGTPTNMELMVLYGYPAQDGPLNNPGGNVPYKPCKIGPCQQKLLKSPIFPPGSACTGGSITAAGYVPATFVSMWDCQGTASNCAQNAPAYKNSCSAAGNTPMECTFFGFPFAGVGPAYICQCCHYQ